MSKNEENERENSRLQRKDNKLTKVNKKRGNDNGRPSSEGGKPDISKTFPNFSALTETERLIFFQALTTARKNVEERGIPTRQCFGTVHDEYLKYFTQDQKEKEVIENVKQTSHPTSSLIVRDDNNMSSCINKSTFKVGPQDFSDKKSGMPSSKIRITSAKGKKLVTNEPGFWDPCESIVQKNTNQMIDLYLRKKKRNETKCSNVQLTKEKSAKSTTSKTQLSNKKKTEAGRKKTESLEARTMAKTTPKVRNTSRFDALNTEEKEIFFRTLQKAHDNIIKKNPEKEGEILPVNAIMERYRGDRQAMAVFTTSQESRRREEGRRNLRVKVILTSGDNERLSKTKSQVLSDAVREVSDRRHKSAESLQLEGKETRVIDATHDHAHQSESSLSIKGKASKDSLEINEKNTTKLNGQKQITKFEDTKEKEKNSEECLEPQAKEKKKIKRKEKKLSNPKKLKKSPIATYDPKITETLNVDKLDLITVDAEKKNIKDTEKKLTVQKKKHSKNKTQKMTEQEKEEQQKKEEHLEQDFLFEPKNLSPLGNTDHQNLKELDGSELKKEQYQMEAEKCQVIDAEEIQENCEKKILEPQVTSTAVSASEKNCEETCWGLGGEQNEETIKEIEISEETWWGMEGEQNEEAIKEKEISEETLSEEEKQEVECIIASEIENEKGIKADTFEQKEETILELNLGSLKSVTSEEVALVDSNLTIKEESTTAVKSFLLDDDNGFEAEGMTRLPEPGQENPELLTVEAQREITAEASVLQEVFEGTSLIEENPREGKETKEISTDFAFGKVMFVDDDVSEKVKKLIYYLEEKIQKEEHLEKEYLQLLVDYVDYLSKVLDSLVLREEQHQKQVQETYTVPEVHLTFDDTKTKSKKKEDAPRKDLIPRSVSTQDLRRVHSENSIIEIKAEKPKEKRSSTKSDEETSMVMESESSSDSEREVRFIPINTGDKKIKMTNIRLLQDLLHQRAEFVEGSIADFKIVHHPEAEDFVPTGQEKPPTIEFLTDEDEENMQEDRKTKFFKILLKCCLCGKKKTEENGLFENLKGEAVRADVYDVKKEDPASVTLNQSTMEVLKAAERKKIIDKYYSQD